MGMSDHKKKAWIVTAVLLVILFTWAIMAVHDSAVTAARVARANNSKAPASCPFSKVPPTQQGESKKKSPCCHSKSSENKKSEEEVKSADQMNASAAEKFGKYADMNDADLEEFLKQFTPEQLAKCPHLKARKTVKKK